MEISGGDEILLDYSSDESVRYSMHLAKEKFSKEYFKDFENAISLVIAVEQLDAFDLEEAFIQ